MNRDIQQLDRIRALVEESPIDAQEKKPILEKIEELKSPLETDKWIYRIVVSALSAAIILIFPLAMFASEEFIKLLLPLSTAAVGGLVGLLAPSPGRQ
ncbi:hypothetical protein SAMN05216403_1432 [Nitrosospira multiformis ATCC 25196]|uniref:Uncharacterized protein n=1 Tax=Nitrosospira multiformis (strain ATCC 25196 / NCIMB 11849 / C 71) TaxID=323848 RepID=A0A1H5Y388_NITMU|nr:hypothetical protein [Nitrosospira multiformis]SEG18080.1 hypothetical protein SAMN05216403_1432 [Nitrosospira multiformis ATCC 25196]